MDVVGQLMRKTMSEKKKPSQENEAALQARLRQLELEKSLRLQQTQKSPGANPMGETPRKGFGSRQGIAHLRHTEFQRRGPTPPPPGPAVPEPGKARFGGTFLKTPLPGIIRADSTPGFELIEPVPAVPSAPAPAAPSGAPPKDPRVPPSRHAVPPISSPGPAAPSGVMPAGRPLPGDKPAAGPAKEVAQAKPAASPPIPAAAQFDPKGNVVGGSAVSKAPLPAVYHAGMKSAEDAAKSKSEPARPPVAAATPGGPEGPIVVPEGAEILKDSGAKASPGTTRAKRFKNPTLPSKARPT